MPSLRTEPYVYPHVPEWRNAPQGGTEEGGRSIPPLWTVPASLPASTRSSAEEAQAREQQARGRGVEEGRAQAKTEAEGQVAIVRGELARALEAFQRERAAYFQRIEAEVVQLALAISRKILHRETQLDPLLLAGVVRVELDKFEAGTGVRLHVHSSRLDAWQKAFASQLGGGPVVEFVPDDSLRIDQCALETVLGTTDLSLDAQLKEIEQGFFDLLAQRPGNLR